RKDGTYNTSWTGTGVTHLLRNERYCGDVLARKTYTPNFKDHKSKKNTGQKNKYYHPDHHEAIVPRNVWNAVQRILNSHTYGHGGAYLPMQIIDTGVLTGFISMNRSWAGFEASDYYRASQIAMGLLDEELDEDLENIYLPEGGHRFTGLKDDHGISQIARELTEAEQQIRDEMEGRNQERQDLHKQAEIVKTFQVVSGEMFSRIYEPVLRIGQKQITFNQSCTAKMHAEYVELLFNPVERMIVVRPCEKGYPNAIEWDSGARGATCLCRIIYESMGWDTDYAYRIPCQTVMIELQDGTIQPILLFDLDNYIGRAVNKKEEIMLAREEQERWEKLEADAKSYFFPPEEEEEPQELAEIEEQVQKAIELNKKIFGTPVFKHTSTFRSIDGNGSWEEWLAPARPLDTNHRYEPDEVDAMLRSIQEDPPELPQEDTYNRIVDATVTADTGEEGE
nr:recombinase family protein [Lachnospiraceae bacterium]